MGVDDGCHFNFIFDMAINCEICNFI